MPTQPSPTGVVDDMRALTKQDVADRLQISVRSVERLIEQGDIKTLQPSKRGVTPRISPQALRDYLGGAV